MRIHRVPRIDLFCPEKCDDAPPMSLENVDMTRIAYTDLDTQDEKRIQNIWDGTDRDSRRLFGTWRGETCLDILPSEPPPPGYAYHGGRLTRIPTQLCRTI